MLKFKLTTLISRTNGDLEIVHPNVFYKGKCLGNIIGEEVICSSFENMELIRELNLESSTWIVFNFEDLKKHSDIIVKSKIQFQPVNGDINTVECVGDFDRIHSIEMCIKYLTKYLKIPYTYYTGTPHETRIPHERAEPS